MPTLEHPRARWSVAGFAAFWAAPVLKPGGPTILAPDIVGYWPFALDAVRGRTDYIQRIADLLDLVPDIRLEVAEAKEGDEVSFIRWIARGTPPVGPREWSGVDRVLTRDGLVTENRIYSDHPAFARLPGSRAL